MSKCLDITYSYGKMVVKGITGDQMLIHWTATTKRAKQLKNEFGPVWKKIGIPSSMPCFEGGIGILIESLDGKHVRNVPLIETEGV